MIRTRSILRIAGWTLGVLAILVLAIAALHLPPARRAVLSLVSRALSERQIGLTADELRYNLLDLSVSIRNLTLRSLAAPSAPPFVRAERASIDISLLSLLAGRYVVESGDVRGLEFDYVTDETNHDNLPPAADAGQDSKPSASVEYAVHDFAVSGGRVRYEDRARGIEVEAPLVSLCVDHDALQPRHTLAVDFGAGSARVHDRMLVVDRLAGRIDAGNDDVAIEELVLDAEGSHLSVSGTLEDFARPRADLRLAADLDVPRAAAAAGIDDRIGGALRLDVHAAGLLDALAIEGTASGRDVSFRQLAPADMNLSAAYDAQTGRVNIGTLRVQAPWGRIAGDAQVALDGSGESRVRGEITGLDAAALMTAIELPYAAATRMDARVQASWPGADYRAASGHLEASFEETGPTSRPGNVPLSGRLDLDARSGSVMLRIDGLRSGPMQADGRVSLSKANELGGTAGLRVADIEAAVRTIESQLGRRRGSLLPVPVRGTVSVDARLGGSLEAPAATIVLEAPDVTIGAASGLAAEAVADYTTARVDLERLDIGWRDARAHAAGRVELTGARRLDITMSADGLSIPALVEMAGQDATVYTGTVALAGRAAGTTSNPEASIDVDASELSAYGEDLGTLTASMALGNRVLTVSRLTLEKPQSGDPGRLDLEGSYDLPRERYTFDLRSSNLRFTDLVLPDGRSLTGRLTLDGRGEGTLAVPAGTIDLKAEDVSFAGDDFGTVSTRVALADGRADVTAEADRFRTRVDARIDVAAPYASTVTARIDELDFEALPLHLETPLTGHVSTSVQASGDLARPAEGRADVAIDALSGEWNGRPFQLDGPASLHYGDERVTIDRLTAVAQASRLSLQGTLPLTDAGGEGRIQLDSRLDLATLVQYVPTETPVSGEGVVTLAGTITGTLESIDPQLTLAVDDGLLLSPALEPGISNLSVRAGVADGTAVLERLDASWGSASLAVSGRMPLTMLPDLPVTIPRPPGSAEVKASLTGLDPAAVPGAPAGLAGRISIDAQGSATSVEDLSTISGRVTFPELEIAFRELLLTEPEPVAIAVQDGRATIEQFALGGSVGELSARGGVTLVGERTVDLTTEGTIDLAALSIFTDAVRAEGATRLDIAARGTLDNPELTGAIDVADAAMAIDDPRIAAEGLSAHVTLAGPRVTLESLTGEVNGGTLNASGAVGLGAEGIEDIDLQVSTTDFAFDAPLELRSLSDSTIRVTRRDEAFAVDGQVTIKEAGLTGDINFDTGLLAAITAPRRLDLTEERNPLLERMQFDIDVDTAEPVIVENNLARAEIEADLRVLGTPYETGLSGRLTVLEGGEVTLNERRYQVERGVITFLDERRIAPSFDLRLVTSVSPYDVTIGVAGEPGDTETTLTSDPALPEPDIMALLVTGRTLDDMRGEEYAVAREQMLSYLTGRVGSTLGRGVERATGLSDVRIEPNLIANEADPGARLTVGQDIASGLKLVYSTNLADSNDQIWVAQYDVTRRFQARTVRQSDNSYRLDLRHDVRFGGTPEPRRERRKRPTIASVQVPTDIAPGQQELLHMLGGKVGKPYDYFEMREGVRRIERFYRDQGHLQARVRLHRTQTAETVAVSLTVDPGPLVHVAFEGATPPDDVREEVVEQWRRGVFDAQRIDDGSETLRGWLMRERYLQPTIDATVVDTPSGDRQVTFSLHPGVHSERIVLAFEGAESIDPDQLDRIVDNQGLEPKLFTDPIVVTELLERYYREQGYLSTQIDEPRYEIEGAVARIVLRVNEGPRFTTDRITIAGNRVLATPLLEHELPLVVGQTYLPAVAERSLERIRDLYWKHGYNDVRSDYALVVDRARGAVEVTFTIEEGRQTVVAEVDVEGNEHVDERLIREQARLTTSAPLDVAALGRARKSLYDTGAFSIVDITRDEVEQGAIVGASGSGDLAPADEQKPVRLNVSVREVEPFQLGYGASYDTERGLGGIVEIANHNSLGKARVVGMRARYDAQLHEIRGYLSQPWLRSWPVKTTATIYYREERNPETNVGEAFNFDRKGFTIQQEKELRNSYVWSYGYRYERVRTFDPVPGGRDDTETVSPLTSTFTREGRDEVLDASRGSFTSHGFSFSPSWLGASAPYVKYFGQYFKYFPLQPVRREPLTNELLRPRLVYAVAVRVGLAAGLDGPVPTSERFFAGGSSTLRGFEQNAVGPITADGTPAGGEALFVINNELRMPLVSIVDGVVFVDVGNVFDRVRDFTLADLRESAGVGLRLRTPWFLVRGDWGFVLDHRSGERRSRFYFSIGQAF